MTLDQLKLAFRLSNVERYCTKPIVGEKQKVDQHSYRATLTYLFLGGKEVEAALLHDSEEALCGDIPSPAKKKLQGYEYFSNMRPDFSVPEEKSLFKLADELELVIYLAQQRAMGNTLVEEMYEEVRESVLERAALLKKTNEVKKLIKELSK